jgi:hypothetical protein
MRSPAAAIAWEFRHRHRWGLIALAGYLLVLVILKLLIPEPGRTFNIDSGEKFGVIVMMPLTATFMYVLTVFSFGLSGDVAGRASMYPARLFTLPVSNAELTLWPMMYGGAAMALLWLATRFLAVWPPGFDIPVMWPALAAVSLLAWTQALMWMPYGLRGLRVILAVLWLGTIDSIVLLALRYNMSEAVMVAIVAPPIPLAYVAARLAVARARPGDVPDWHGWFVRPARTAVVPADQRKNFSSPARAQAWFEWRRHGWSLPGWIAILLPFELALLKVAGSSQALVFLILLGVLITPPFMAAFTAAAVARANPSVSDAYGLAPFIATRPLTTATLIAAKLTAMIWSTVATWALVLVAIPIGMRWSGTWPVLTGKIREAVDFMGALRTVVLVLLILALFITATWKQLIQGLFIGLTGRERLIKGAVIFAVAVFTVLGPLGQWIYDTKSVQHVLWDAVPLILAVLAGAKMFAATWVATRLWRGRVLSDRTLVAGAALWCGAVLALYGVLAWFMSTPFFPRYVLMLLAILFVPLARLSAAPLALAWNRHR